MAPIRHLSDRVPPRDGTPKARAKEKEKVEVEKAEKRKGKVKKGKGKGKGGKKGTYNHHHFNYYAPYFADDWSWYSDEEAWR